MINKTASDEFGLCGLAEITQSKLVTELSLERAESSLESEEVYSETGTYSPESGKTSSEPDSDFPESYVISPVQ
ncbi:hypothetical protein [Fumia xinanensis]|uniref:Uncharacterized protein n=1 Tax=Fumia xinanensis TaxID=2763659 RepID=A0A926E3E9_9FIRM|nr:hypothetical protein [Fumia xinanensis]MBC8560974.1 hypothetical protein [Fumia xinanensis]